MGHRLWGVALAAALGAQLPLPARAAQGCSMVGDLCMCQDAGGNEWDVSELSFGDHDTKVRTLSLPSVTLHEKV